MYRLFNGGFTYHSTDHFRWSVEWSPPSVLGDPDLRALLQALPTRSDMEAMVSCLEEVHRRDLQLVRTEVQSLADRHYRRNDSGFPGKSQLSNGKGTDLANFPCIFPTTPIGRVRGLEPS